MQIQLKHPIQAHGETIVALTLPDKVTVKNMRAMDDAKGEVGRLAALIGALANLPPSSVDQISAEDYFTIAEAISDFLPWLPPTGGT